AAGRAEQREEFPMVDVEGEIVDGGEVAEPLRDVAERYERFCVRIRPRREGATDIAERFHCLSPSLLWQSSSGKARSGLRPGSAKRNALMKLPGRGFRAIRLGPLLAGHDPGPGACEQALRLGVQRRVGEELGE